ncbi:MAG TPA: HAD-IA family hydrolase [Candidatus Saccharimonadales bacterium]|nr:HAD-IA family hydrolase [Candidatus Saccharimonadales bacterium]
MRTVIFDFDGTIADSFALAIAIFHELTDGRHYARATVQEIDALRGMHAQEIIRYLGIRWWRLPFLLARGRTIMRKRVSELKPFPGIEPVLQQLHKDGVRMFVLSSNSADTIGRFLEAHHLRQYFDQLYGGAGLFNKAARLRKIMHDNHLHLQNCFYVGDEVRDIVAARQAGIRCIAVGWGFNNVTSLTSHRPYAVIERPEELVRAAQNKTKV